MIGRLTAALVIVLAACAAPTVAEADPVRARIPWVGTNPYGFLIGDSLVEQCGESWGMDWRSLGFIGWPGADTRAMRERLDGTGSGWPDWTVTESSVEEERVWFRDAGWLVIGLGTNDVKIMGPGEFAGNIDWYMQQSRGRPVLWFTIHNPPFQAQVDAFNAELEAATERWPNLRLLPWHLWARYNPGALLSDQVHISTSFGCIEGRDRLIRSGAPAEDSGRAQPVGYWYEDPATTGPVKLNGWGAARLPTADAPLQVNVRADWQHVGRWPVDRETGDVWAIAAGGRGFGFEIDPGFRGRLLCLDLVDEAGQWTALGCRKV